MSGLSRVSSRLEKERRHSQIDQHFMQLVMHTQGNIRRQPKIDCRQDVRVGAGRALWRKIFQKIPLPKGKRTAGKSKSNSNGDPNKNVGTLKKENEKLKGGNSKKNSNDERSQDLPFRRLRSFWVCISWSKCQLLGF